MPEINILCLIIYNVSYYILTLHNYISNPYNESVLVFKHLTYLNSTFNYHKETSICLLHLWVGHATDY